MIQSISAWLGLVAILLAIVNTIWVWVRTSGSDTATRFKAVEEEIEGQAAWARENLKEHDRRIQSVEGELRHMPTQAAVTGLTVSITELNGRLAVLDSELEGLTRTVRRIDDHLRNSA